MIKQSFYWLALFAVTLFSLPTKMPLLLADEVDFNRDVRPLLAEKCYHCHGPDEEKREAELRFDIAEEAEHVFESGDFLERVLSDDPDMIMPPPGQKMELTDAERELFTRWVDSGAKYEDHWAFSALPNEVPVPEITESNWPKQTLDRFVLARLDAEGLRPSEPADSLRWLRRASFVLTGLPPSLEAMDTFNRSLAAAKDEEQRDSAYGTAVDTLLALPAFGEHMAVDWLDAARYADSYGYQSDKLNTQWPYRDWVVRALNENLPYDQFLIWQLAGDLLPNPTRDQRLATAFNRIHRLNNEGGAVFEEWRLENVADRVHTYGTAVLGLTMECCRCHDHKYDPIPTRDYYSLSAFFNSIDENGMYDRTEKVPSPTMLLPTSEQEVALDQAAKKLKEAEQNFASQIESAGDRFDQWIAQSRSPKPSQPIVALDFDESDDQPADDTYFESTSDKTRIDDTKRVNVEDNLLPRLVTTPIDSKERPRRALHLDGERGIVIQGVEHFDRWSTFSVVVTLKDVDRSPLLSVIATRTRGTDAGYNGWDLTITDGHLESRMYRVWPGNAIGVRTVEPIPEDQWVQVTATYDGTSKATGLRLYLNGELLETTLLRDSMLKSANVPVQHGGELTIGQRFRSRGLAGGLIDDVRVYDQTLSAAELVSLASGEPIQVDREFFITSIDSPVAEARKVMLEARKAFVMAEEVAHEIPVMIEMETPREANVLARGQYDAPTSEETLVSRQTLQGIGPDLPNDAPLNRLGLAQWTVDPHHPLTGRVVVNRLWGNFFGQGLVSTPENFGTTGEEPTHPELLDWLARDFIDHQWDVKRFCRNVVLSATFRQQSAANKELIERDPKNLLMARGAAYRLSGEQIRDMAIQVSGLLNNEIGGPPVSPYQAGRDLWRESNGMSPPYKQSVGKALYRRSIYSVWKRTAPLPNMMAFDATSREVCSVKRTRTNTPMQALVLLNDVQFIETVRVLAQNVILRHDTEEDRIQMAFRSFTGRPCDDAELKLLTDLLREETQYYQGHVDEAEKLIQLGEASQGNVPHAQLAAMTVVFQAILNLDATIWNR